MPELEKFYSGSFTVEMSILYQGVTFCGKRDRMVISVPFRHNRGMGFSLPEILIVTAVIAILTALAFPAFNRARDKGYEITCASRLRQMGNAIYLYAQDQDANLPLIDLWRTADPANRQAKFWYTEIGPYLGVKDHGLSAVWQCPPIRSRRPPGDREMEKPDYAMNADLGMNIQLGRAEAVKAPSVGSLNRKVFLFCSARRYGSYRRTEIAAFGPGIGWGDHVSPFSEQSHFCQIHNGQANVLFGDCHVEAKTFPDINDADMWNK